MKPLYVCFLLSACATASPETSGDDMQVLDASPSEDAAVVDSPGPCTVTTRNLLVNASFDDAPVGSGWTATPIDPAYPLIGDDTSGGIAAHSGADRAWMGGLQKPSAQNRDVLYQDVQIPATTTALALSGYYEVRTAESTAGAFDSATVELATQQNLRLDLVQTLDDDHATTAWTAFSKSFTSTYAGMTVRVRFSSASDSTNATSFYFDTVELDATFCE